jgi:hypothetical protein
MCASQDGVGYAPGMRRARQRRSGVTIVAALVLSSFAGIVAFIRAPELFWGPWGWVGMVVLLVADVLASYLVFKATLPSPSDE